MGLDMYLTGDKFHAGGVFNKETREYEPVEPTYVGGFKLSSERLELGYWRKNAPLHTLIVNRFANGKDDCRPIDLDEEQLREIASLLRSKTLPTDEQSSGFFFGGEEWWAECRKNADEDAKVFEAAADWLDSDDAKFWNSVEYQASW
tara:strand:- start:627 stop:1067 length:441 start_codon:yes stop_codon:yes gene_type:complete